MIPAGYEIRNGDEVRTAKGSKAVVRLLDGSLVEMGERSDLSVTRAMEGHDDSSGWRPGHCAGGEADVQAGLYVATDDGLVSVKGTIFSVNHGSEGLARGSD